MYTVYIFLSLLFVHAKLTHHSLTRSKKSADRGIILWVNSLTNILLEPSIVPCRACHQPKIFIYSQDFWEIPPNVVFYFSKNGDIFVNYDEINGTSASHLQRNNQPKRQNYFQHNKWTEIYLPEYASSHNRLISVPFNYIKSFD